MVSANTEDALLTRAIEEHVSGQSAEMVDAGIDGVTAGRLPAYSGGINAETTVRVYSTIDGRPSDIMPQMLRAALRKRLPNGRSAFWIEGMLGERPPEYSGGTMLCYLHPDHPMRAELDEIGLSGRFCNPYEPTRSKSNIPTEMDVEMHMKSRHKQEWAVIQRQLQAKRDDAAYERQAQLLATAIAGAQAGNAKARGA